MAVLVKLPHVLIEEERWRPARPYSHCRWLLYQGRQRRSCGTLAVVEVCRVKNTLAGVKAQWWGYCDQHRQGRVVIDGVVYEAFEPTEHWLKEWVG